MSGLLILSRPDTEVQKVRRVGAIAVDRERAETPGGLASALEYGKRRMIYGLAQRGFEFVDEADEFDPLTGKQVAGWEVRGPLAHTEASDSAAPDPGPLDPRGIVDFGRLAERERLEKERQAKHLDTQGKELVDYELVATFRKRIKSPLRFI